MSNAVIIDAEITGDLSASLTARAERYRGHLARSTDEALQAFDELAAARAEAAQGEWGLFLQAAGINDTTARVQLQLREKIRSDPRFAERFRAGWLSESSGRELLSAPPAVQAAVLARPAESKPPTVAEIREAKRESAGTNRATSHTPPLPPAPPLVLTPHTPSAPTGTATVIASVPAGGLPPMLQLGAPAALPPPLFSPPRSVLLNPAPAEAFAELEARMRAAGHLLSWDGEKERFSVVEGGGATPISYSHHLPQDWEACARRCAQLLAPASSAGEWLEVDTDDLLGVTLRLRTDGLSPVVADAIGQAAETLRLLALGQAHAVDSILLTELATALDAEPSQRRGTLRTVLRLLADEAEEIARAALPPVTAVSPPSDGDDDTLSAARDLERDIAATLRQHGHSGPLTRKDEARQLTERLDALAGELDDATYERLAHEIGRLRPPAKGEA